MLVDKLKVVLANTFTMYMKTHGYHWNVIGSDFPQYHDFFGDLYAEVHGAVDDIAEQLRQINSFAPGSLQRMKELSELEEDDLVPNAAKMVVNLIAANDKVLLSLVECYEMAEEAKEYGLSNFLQDRITAHKKHGWMLKATAGQKS
ncbi:Dps DNA-binding ferritin-like protein (oxidative damage protectant) [uncultured Caudovirales phage]|uniref:Dps DNA-binding ferritin-like protein (Oxidative damage protectant) n=1 Tax=uncultured Caudovirales phage TaxID=2100421 RepID=A0A6J5PS31_9CAUD|nr:Dps DNA-binding ferritin-like protein (oxidative damage protectant) [uncultured Caudovirales phage]CAB4176978.1 Dps DNA-binding ferritin-like protein (oxidative damage protectant) [uncultured Caudovirales phage]CAB4182135.1 Dps DNA-binding ferritin-like protein (oxidative damage protectant) [uncultured Caudovirales phage]CAB4190774.1 Dps DNA-binding ferritin-like protein (oxidative damage protectant) [uncultured Caudovirales phage]CAB4211127.1 Dps DNA-binding ferritin-like protein (oxidative